jgi:fibronectin-binding autotransporter adhesin
MSARAPMGFRRTLRAGPLLSSTAIAIGLAATAAPAYAQTWLGGTSDAETPTNWSGNAVPGVGDDAVVNGGAPNQPFLFGAATYNSLAISAGSYTIGGTLAVNSGTTLSGTGILNINVGGILNSNLVAGSTGTSTISGTINGNLTISNGAVSFTAGSFIDAATIGVTGGTLTTQANTIADAAAVTVSGGTFTVTGTDTVGTISQSGGTIDGTGTLTTATFSQTGGEIAAGATVSATTSADLQGGIIAGTLNTANAATVQTGTTLLSGTIAGSVGVTSQLNLDGGSVTGAINLSSGTLHAVGASTVAGTALTVVTNTGSTISAAAGETLTIQSHINLDATTTTTFGSATATGIVAIAPASASIGNGSHVVIAGGTVRMDSSLQLFTNSGGLLSRTVTINAGASLDTNGQSVERISNLTGAGVITNGGATETEVRFESDAASAFSGVIEKGTGDIRVVKQLGGTLTLSGANTYTGTTTVQAGVLNVTGSLASAAVNVTGGSLQVDGASLADSAAVTLSGTGNLTLTGSETIGSLAGIAGTTVTLGANTLTTGGNDTSTTLAGVIGGTGGITKEGTGNFSLSGANTYDGVTTVNAGTVTAGSNAALGSTVGGTTVAAGATLALTGGITIAAGEAISLAGTGVANGGVLRNVSGNNTVNGPITLAGNALITNDDTDFADQLNIAGGVTGTNTNLTLGGAGAFNVTGVINTDSGTLTKNGAGIAFLQAANTFTGATTINDGAVVVNSGSALSDTALVTTNAPGRLGIQISEAVGNIAGGGQILIYTNQTLTAGDATDSTFSGTIGDNTVGDAGGFTKAGSGKLVLSGTNTYTGATTVNAGTLAVNGSIAASSGLTVGVGGTVGGTGFLPSAIINGTLAPGNSIGTITVNGNLGFGAGSTYAVEVSPTAADRTNVTGTATLTGATAVATYEPGSYVAKQYVIVNAAGGVVGTFAGLNGTAPAGFSHSLSYDALNAYLNLVLLMSTGVGPYSDLNQNQKGVADALSSYFNTTGGIPGAFAALTKDGLTANSGETGTAAQAAGMGFGGTFMDMIGGPDLGGTGSGSGGYGDGAAAFASQRPSPAAERFARMSYAAEELGGGTDANTRALRLQHRLETGYGDGAAPRPERFSVWGAALGGGVSLAGDPAIGSQAVSGNAVGLASGFDYANGSTRAGIALGASWSSTTLGGGLGGASVGNVSVGLRASHDFGRLYLAGAAAYGAHFATTTRAFAGETYTAAFTGQSISARAEAGWRIRTKPVDILPFVAARIVSFSTPAYAETGSGAGTFALGYQPQSGLEARSELGIRLHKSIDSADGSRTVFSGSLGWAHYFSRGRTVTAGFANLPGTQFVTQGATGASDTALVSLGVSHSFANGVRLSLDADGEFGAGTIGYAGKGKISFNW